MLKYSTKQFKQINTWGRNRMIPKGWSEMQTGMVTEGIGKHFINVYTHIFFLNTTTNIWYVGLVLNDTTAMLNDNNI